jgi:hypothetical protein
MKTVYLIKSKLRKWEWGGKYSGMIFNDDKARLIGFVENMDRAKAYIGFVTQERFENTPGVFVDRREHGEDLNYQVDLVYHSQSVIRYYFQAIERID